LIYDTDHRIVSIKDAKGQTFVTNHYDNEGRVHQQDLGTGSGTFDYSVANQNTFTDKEGNVTRFLLNADGMVTSQEQFTKGLRAGEPASYVTTVIYNTNNLPLWMTYPEGNGVKYIYDSSNTDARARKNILTVRRKENMSACDYDPVDI
ncbi:MAG: hypothetical protein K8S27_05085, partial [Candidatus Omnitrophica bacterium]|nr:hypothetical protein [Candidatus Omnitrophota bacterium]